MVFKENGQINPESRERHKGMAKMEEVYTSSVSAMMHAVEEPLAFVIE